MKLLLFSEVIQMAKTREDILKALRNVDYSIDERLKLVEKLVTDAASIPYTNANHPEITNVKQALDLLLYQETVIEMVSAPNNFGNYEIGSSISAPNTISWTSNNTLRNKRMVVSGGSSINQVIADNVNQFTFGSPMNVTTSFTLNANDGIKDVSKTMSFTFTNRVIWGSSISTTYDVTLINSLQNYRLSTGRNVGNITANAASGEYIYFCLPTSYGVPTFTVNGFIGGFEAVNNVNFTNRYGYTTEYTIYRSDNPSLGSLTINVK